jgi:hypothetical protein
MEVTLLCTSGSTPDDEDAAAAAALAAAAARADMCFGDPPLWESMEGAGLSVTELVCEMRWLRFGNVSATDGLSRGPQGMPGAGLEAIL